MQDWMQVDVDLPCGGLDLSFLQAVYEDSYFFLVRGLPLSAVITEEFIGAFIKAGSVFMISRNTKIDHHDTAAVTQDGELVLNLTRKTHHQLGLEGQVAEHHKKTKDKYVVTIKMKETCFKPGRKHYERVKNVFLEEKHLKFDFLVTWEPHDDKISSYSIGAYLKSLGYECHECSLDWLKDTSSFIDTPVINADTPDGSDVACSQVDYYEWLGCQACGIPLGRGHQECEGFVSELTCPTPSTVLSTVTHCKLTGFLTPKAISKTLSLLKDLLKSHSLPWVALTAHGFHDSPFTSSSKQHSYCFSGDHSFTTVLFPDDKMWVYRAVGKHDAP